MTRTRYPISRAMGNLVGLYALWILVELIQMYLEGPPKGCWVQTCFGFSWLDEDPVNSLGTSALCLCFFILGASISWVRPRLGSFLSGMGWLSYFLFSFMSSVPHGYWYRYHIEWGGSALLLLAPAFWYFYACVRDEPRERARRRIPPAELI